MILELWIGGGGHWFVDRDLGHVQVGEAYEAADGTWSVVVNDKTFPAPDLDAVKRIFLENYERSKVVLSPLSAVEDGEVGYDGFEVVTLT